MHLNPGACTDHFCNQLGGGDYFQSSVGHQRGYGLFGDVIRFITPLVTKAGKYLGRHLLASGKNLIDDIARGEDFKTSAKIRLQQTRKKIKDDFLQKLQQGGSMKKGIKRKRSPKSYHSKTKRRKLKPDIFTTKKKKKNR